MAALVMFAIGAFLLILRREEAIAIDYYPAFPHVFSGDYEDNTGWVARISVSVTDRDNVLLDRALVSQKGSTSPGIDGDFIIYTKPRAALRGTKAYNGTVLLHRNSANCTYTVNRAAIEDEMPLGLASMLGFRVEYPLCVGWDVCSGMKYVDSRIYFNKKADEWFKQIPNVAGEPDNITVLVDSETHIPFTATRFHPGHPGTFDPSRRIETAIKMTSNNPVVDFSLPKNWQLKCRNLDAMIHTDSKDVFYSTSKGSDFVHVWLSDMPVGGDVSVTFMAHPIPPCPCTTCIRFQPNPLTFTAANYSEKQIVEFVYEKDGVTNFMFVVNGGGYYNRSSTEYGTVFSCHSGVTGKSC